MKKVIYTLIAIHFSLITVNAQSQYGWFFQNPLPQNNSLYDVFMLNSNTIASVGTYGMIIKSTNGGTSWAIQSWANIVAILTDVAFADQNTGYLTGFFGVVGKTTNGGSNWSLLQVPVSEFFHGIAIIDANNVYIAAYQGKVLKTTDGGQNWTVLPIGTDTDLRGIVFFNANTGVANGVTGKIFRTTNGGLNWSYVQAIDTLKNIEDMHFSAHPDDMIKAELDRYIVWPGQALAYKIGELKIKELRKKAEEELGSKFDIRSFHDEVLKNGAVPLSLLEKNINDWIASRK